MCGESPELGTDEVCEATGAKTPMTTGGEGKDALVTLQQSFLLT